MYIICNSVMEQIHPEPTLVWSMLLAITNLNPFRNSMLFHTVVTHAVTCCYMAHYTVLPCVITLLPDTVR